ncbi:MAG: ParB/RepB/Spo0J family partition protein [Caldilineaceae bacterium]|nr:ParB/RepB/Spo0J family partition protein [Caldilineaceae bacterium]
MNENTPRRRRGLGRGLGALISSSSVAGEQEREALIAQAEAGGIRLLPVAEIIPNPHQPRTVFNPEALAELTASIAEHGIIQPLIVTESLDEPQRFWLIAGERRWRAAQQAGLESVPVIVREASPQQLLEWALVENVQRADLNPLEEATAYDALMTGFGLTQAQVAQRVGKSRSAVANTVRLLGLPPSVQGAVSDGQISAGHARTLLALPDQAAMETALAQVIDRELTVRQTEALVRRLLEPPPPPAPAESQENRAHLTALEGRFRSSLGTKVSLERKPDGSGRLVIHFFNDGDLDSIYHQIVGEEDI